MRSNPRQALDDLPHIAGLGQTITPVLQLSWLALFLVVYSSLLEIKTVVQRLSWELADNVTAPGTSQRGHRSACQKQGECGWMLLISYTQEA